MDDDFQAKRKPDLAMEIPLTNRQPILSPDEAKEMGIRPDMKVCGTCAHFEHEHGQHHMAMTRFLERLVRENNWQVHHLCSTPDELGICGQSTAGTRGESVMLTGARHAACGMHRPRNGLLRIRRK